jgi:hypothetical protein
MDAQAGERLQKAMAALPDDQNYYDDVVAKQLDPTSTWCDHRPDRFSTDNVAIFSSGWGDGMYSTYWGLDAGDRPVCLVTDFQVVDAKVPVKG